MIEAKTWEEFRETGLLLLVNQFLHIFGWAIVVDVDENDNVTSCYPARVRFRGFSNESTLNAYVKISQYMKNNAETLLKEAKS